MPRFRDEITQITQVVKGEITSITNVVRTIPSRLPHQELPRVRYDQIDLARGIAIALMFLSHTVMALNTYHHLPPYALVPIHAITKFSSSLFFVVFGVTLSLFYVEAYGTESWPKKRNRLLWRSLMVLVWYKILTIVQMFQTYPREEIVDRLLFKSFTDFAEVLNFYWLIMIWILLLIPLWARVNWLFHFTIIAALAVGGTWLNQNFDFWGIWQLKAMIVENKGSYCFGQFQRGALALFGMFLAGAFVKKSTYRKDRYVLGLLFLVLGLLSFGYFMYLTKQSDESAYMFVKAIAKNFGKHPPNFHFAAFSLGGAFSILGLCLFIPSKLVNLFHPLKVIGKEAFFCFNLHLFIIFVGYRYFLGLRWKVTYTQTLLLFGLVVLMAYLLAPLNTYIKKKGVLWKWLLP